MQLVRSRYPEKTTTCAALAIENINISEGLIKENLFKNERKKRILSESDSSFKAVIKK